MLDKGSAWAHRPKQGRQIGLQLPILLIPFPGNYSASPALQLQGLTLGSFQPPTFQMSMECPCLQLLQSQ